MVDIKCSTCEKLHDNWTGEKGLLCQDCWEAESDKAWWKQAIAVDSTTLTHGQ